jgi:hypothetical protein
MVDMSRTEGVARRRMLSNEKKNAEQKERACGLRAGPPCFHSFENYRTPPQREYVKI